MNKTLPRYTLRTLIAAVTLAAIGCAALANPNEFWASVVFSATVAILGLSVVVAVMTRGGAVGFAICGWLYLGLILLPPNADTDIVPNLLTSRALDAAWHQHPQSMSLKKSPLGDGRALVHDSLTGKLSVYDRWISDPFQRIGHCFFALLFAGLGGLIAEWLSGRSRSEGRSDAGSR